MTTRERKARLIRPEDRESEGMAGGASHKSIVSKGGDGTDLTVYYSLIQPDKRTTGITTRRMRSYSA